MWAIAGHGSSHFDLVKSDGKVCNSETDRKIPQLPEAFKNGRVTMTSRKKQIIFACSLADDSCSCVKLDLRSNSPAWEEMATPPHCDTENFHLAYSERLDKVVATAIAPSKNLLDQNIS